MNNEKPKKNICEICGKEALSGILDNNRIENMKQIRIRYTCIDHYMQLYQKMRGERMKIELSSSHISLYLNFLNILTREIIQNKLILEIILYIQEFLTDPQGRKGVCLRL